MNSKTKPYIYYDTNMVHKKLIKQLQMDYF